MSKGRPSEQLEKLDTWILDGVNFDGERTIIKFDVNKNKNGPYSFENILPKGYRQSKIKIDKGKAYGKQPVILAFKTSNRSNAKIKIKVFNNENIDYILTSDKLVGVPSKAEILEVGVGYSLIAKYKQKYKLN